MLVVNELYLEKHTDSRNQAEQQKKAETR